MHKLTLIPIFAVCSMLAGVAAAEDLRFTSTTNKEPIDYALNEQMVFTITLVDHDDGDRPVTGKNLKWARYGDDGITETGVATSDTPLVIRTAIAKPGFVRITVNYLDDQGAAVTDASHIYDGGAGADIWNIPQRAMPADFASFWDNAVRNLQSTAYTTNRFETCADNNTYNIRYFELSTFAGEQPATGYVVWPKNAAERSLGMTVSFNGYGKPSYQTPPTGDKSRIKVVVSRYGEDFTSTDAEYFSSLWSGDLANYCFRNNNGSVEDTDFYKMLMRDLRALQFVKQLPEWNGTNLVTTGGSMGGYQALGCAALDRDVSSCNAHEPWSADLSSVVDFGRMAGWRPTWTPTLDYIDLKNLATLVRASVTVKAGLGDYTCPPSSEAVLFGNLTCTPRSITYVQDLPHGSTPHGIGSGETTVTINENTVTLKDFEFSMEEQLRVENGEKTFADIDFTDDTKWQRYDSKAQSILHTEEEQPFVRLHQRGIGGSVCVAENCSVSPGEIINIEAEMRIAGHRDKNTTVIYVRMFDEKGSWIKQDVGSVSGWAFSEWSYALYRSDLKLSSSDVWEKLSFKLMVPNGVYAIRPMVSKWDYEENSWVDLRRFTVRTTGSIYQTRALTMGEPTVSGDNSRTYCPAGENLQIDLALVPTNGQNLITAKVIDLNDDVVKRCFDLHLKWKHDLTGWTWHKNWRSDEVIAASNKFSNTLSMGGFAVSKYAMSAVSSPSGVEHYLFGTPLDEKAYERREVTASGIESSQPLGIWVRGDLGRTNVFRWVFSEFDGGWGFRSATKEYLRTQSALMPPIGVGKEEGAWVWLKKDLVVENHEDFGQHFLGIGLTWTKSNLSVIDDMHQKGIVVFPYIEPWGMRVQIGENNVYDRAGQENSDATYARVKAWATNETTETWFFTNKQIAVQALLNSMPQQPNGELAYSDDYYSCWSRWLMTVPDPRIAHPNVMDLSWIARTGAAHETMDGIVFDSVTAGAVDYHNEREDHLKYFDRPLIYDAETLRPCTDGMQHMCDSIGFAARELHPKGKRVWGNIFGIAYRYLSDVMDVYGSEIGTWGNVNANTNISKIAHTSDDADACLRRFYTYHRPVGSQLFDGIWTHATPELTHEMMLAYLENQMLYGFYPGVTSIGGDEEGDDYAHWKRYFDSRKRYERDRDIFKAAIPIIKRLNKVGWEPEIGLVASTNVVQIERYGSTMRDELLFAIHNDSENTVVTRLSRASADGVEFTSLSPVYKGESLSAADGDWTVELAPWQTVVLKGEVATLDKDGKYGLTGDGDLHVRAAVELEGARSGDLYVAAGAKVRFGEYRQLPAQPPVMEYGTENILWYDPSRVGLMSIGDTASTTPAASKLTLRNIANLDWYNLVGGVRSAAVVNQAVGSGRELPWLDYNRDLTGNGSTMRFVDGGKPTNNLFSVRSGFMVLDTRGGGGNPLVDTALAGYPGAYSYLRNRSSASSPIFSANNHHDFVTNSLVFLNARQVEAGKETFNACGEVLSFDFTEEFPLKALGNFVDGAANHLCHGEVLFYREPLTLQQRRDTEAYLMYKWLGKVAGGYGSFTNLVVHGEGEVTLPADRTCWPIIADDFTGIVHVEEPEQPVDSQIWILPNVAYGATFAIQLTNVVTQAASGDTIRISPGRYSMDDVYMRSGTYPISGDTVIWNVHVYPNGKVLHFEGDTIGRWDNQVIITGNGCFYKRAGKGDDGTTFKGITFRGFRCSDNPTAKPSGSSGNLTADCCGGAIRGAKGIVAENCVFESNYARTAGAVENLTCRECRFVNNRSAYAGGAAHAGCFYNCEFVGNQSAGTAGALWWASEIHGCTFLTNTAKSAGAVCAVESSTISNCVFRGNYANEEGGAIILRPNCKIADCEFVDNFAASFGGAICGGTADGNGNGGYNEEIQRCIFRGNCASNNLGGAVYIVDALVSGSNRQYYPPSRVSDCVFEDNRASSSGGAIYGCALSNCSFTANYCTGSGMQSGVAVYNERRSSNNCDIVSCRFTGNYVCGNGAPNQITSIVEMNSSGKVRDCVFVGNFITNSNNSATFAGVLHNGSSANLDETRVFNCTFVSNAVWRGSMVYRLACDNCDFIQNEMSWAGGVAHSSKVTNGRLIGNRKWAYYHPGSFSQFGGAYNASDAGAAVDGLQSQFAGCTMDGGVICKCVLNRCVIPSCTNAGSYCVFFGGGNFVTNTLVTGPLGNLDSKTTFRGIIYDWGGSPTLSRFVNCTFAGLSVRPKLIWRDPLSFVYKGSTGTYPLDFVNCICHDYGVEGNDALDFTFGFEKLVDAPSGVSFYNCLAGVFTNRSQGVEWSNFDNNQLITNATAQLVLTDADMAATHCPRYAPQPESAACGIGDASGFTDNDFDLAGNLRLCGSKIDLGCYQVSDVGVREDEKLITIDLSAGETNTIAHALAKAGLGYSDLNGGNYCDFAIVKSGAGVLEFSSPDDGGQTLSGWTGDLLIEAGVVAVHLPAAPTDESYAWLLGTNTIGRIVVADGASLYIESAGADSVNLRSGISRPIHLAGAGTTEFPGALTLKSTTSDMYGYRRLLPNLVYLDADATVCFLDGGNSTLAMEYRNWFLCNHVLTLFSQLDDGSELITTGAFYPGSTTTDFAPEAAAIFDNIYLYSRSGKNGLFRNYAEGNVLVFRHGSGFSYNSSGAYGERWAMIFESTANANFNNCNYGIVGSGIATNGSGMAYGPVVIERDLTIRHESYQETGYESKDINVGFLGPISGSGGLTMAMQSNHPYAMSTLDLAGINTFTGPISLSGITLALFNPRSIPSGIDAGSVTLDNCDIALCYATADDAELAFAATTFAGEGRIGPTAATSGVTKHDVSFVSLTKIGQGTLEIDARLTGGDLDIQCGTVKVCNAVWPLSSVGALTGTGTLDLDGGILIVESVDFSQGLRIVNGTIHEPKLQLEDFEFSIEQRERDERGASTLAEVDFADDSTWRRYESKSHCFPHPDDDPPFVRFTSIGNGNGAMPASPCSVVPGEIICIDTTLRKPDSPAENTAIIYVMTYDQNGDWIKTDLGNITGWSFSMSSYAFVKYPITIDTTNNWESMSFKMIVPEGVYAIQPIMAMWRGDQVDCSQLRVRSTGGVFTTRRLNLGQPIRVTDTALTYLPEGENLQIDLSLVPTNGQNLITAKVIDLNADVVKRCFDLHLKWNHNLIGWDWHKNWRNDLVITSSNRYSNISTVGGFPVSQYAMTAVSSPSGDSHYFFGTPLDEKAYERRVVTGDGIESSQPLGIWVRGDVGRTNVFRWICSEFTGNWGFRSATKEYLRTQSALMSPVGIGREEGTWVWPQNALDIEHGEDFGHYFWEAAGQWNVNNTNTILKAQAKGIGAFPYIEPWGMRVNLGASGVRDKTGFDTPEETFALVRSWATNDSMRASSWNYTNTMVAAQAFLNSIPYQPNGEFSYSDDYYDSWARWCRTVPDPRIAHPNVMDMSWLSRIGVTEEIRDGVYLDSVSYYDYRNEREDHLKFFDRPLIYDTETMRPCTDGMQHMCDCITFVADQLHPKGKRVWGNAFGIVYRFNADAIDIYGSEIGTWGSDNNTNLMSHARMTSDANACFQRFYAYHRPMANLLQNGSWLRATPESTHECILAYIENQMLYGLYPGVTTIGGDEEGDDYSHWKRYFDSRKRYERDRDIFKAATPIIRRLNKAGWEPEIGMLADHPSVQIERYGSSVRDELLFAVHNDSPEVIVTRLSRAAADYVEFLSLTPIYKGESLCADGDGWTIELAPWQTVVLKGNNDAIVEDGELEVNGSGLLRVRADVSLTGVYEGDLYIAADASVTFDDVRAVPLQPPVMEYGTENILWFDPSQIALTSIGNPTSATAADSLLVLQNAANPGWYNLVGGGRSAAVVNRAVENGEELPWIDYCRTLTGGKGSTMRFVNSTSAEGNLFRVRSGFMVLDTRGGGGNPLVDTALSGYTGAQSYLRYRSSASSPVFTARNNHDFVTNSPAFLNGRIIDQGRDKFNGCGEVLSFGFDEELPLKALGNYGDNTATFYLRHGEVLFYNERLTVQQRRDTEAYLMYKWLGKIAAGYSTFTNLVVHGEGTLRLPANRECWPIIADDFTGTLIVDDEPAPAAGHVWSLPDPAYGATFAIQLTNVVTQAASDDTIRIAPGRYSMDDVYMQRGTYAISGGTVAWNVHIYPNGKVLHFEGDTIGKWNDQVVITGNGCFYKRGADGDDGTTFKGINFRGFRGSDNPKSVPTSGNLTFNCCGGAIRGTKEIVAENCVFESNYARTSGAVENLTCRGCRFVNNHSAYAGGVAHGGRFYDCEFVGNYSDGTAGALWWASAIQGCAFYENRASGSAGAINTEQKSLVTNCVFRGNTAKAEGGALLLRADNTIVDCCFQDNISGLAAGAIYAGPCDGNGNGGERATIRNCRFAAGTPKITSLVNLSAGCRLLDCCIEGNIITNTASARSLVCNSSTNNFAQLQVIGCTFVSNTVWNGGIVTGLTCTNCDFLVNEVPRSGAVVYNAKAIDCRLLGNRKWDSYLSTGITHYEGAISANSPGCDGVGSEFVACTMDGGVISKSVLNRCVIPSCTNAGSYCVFYGGGNYVTNTLVTGPLGNAASGTKFRGIIYDWGGSPARSRFVNCTFAALAVQPDALWHDPSYFAFMGKGGNGDTYPLDFINCICHDYSSTKGTSDFAFGFARLVDAPSGVSFYNCLAGVFTNCSQGVEWSNFENNLLITNAAAQLVLTDEDIAATHCPRYSPKPLTSACGSGDPSGFTALDLDLAGSWRLCGDKIDLGCYQVSDVGVREAEKLIIIDLSAGETNTLAQALYKANLGYADLNGGNCRDYTITKRGAGILEFPSSEDGGEPLVNWTGDLLIEAGVVTVRLPAAPTDNSYSYLLGTNTIGKIVVSSGASLYIESYGDNANDNLTTGIARPIYIAGAGTDEFPGALTIRTFGSNSSSYRRAQPNTVYLDADATICFLRGGNNNSAQEYKNRFLCGHVLTTLSLGGNALSFISQGVFYPGSTTTQYDAGAAAIFDNTILHSRIGSAGLFRNWSAGNRIVFRNNAGYYCNGGGTYGERWPMVFESSASWLLGAGNFGVVGGGIATNGPGMIYGPVVLDRTISVQHSSNGETGVADKTHNFGFLGPISGPGGLSMSPNRAYAWSILSLAGVNTFTGPLTLSGITLALFNPLSIPQGDDAGRVSLKNCEVALGYAPTADLQFPDTVIEDAFAFRVITPCAVAPRVTFCKLTKTGDGALDLGAVDASTAALVGQLAVTNGALVVNGPWRLTRDEILGAAASTGLRFNVGAQLVPTDATLGELSDIMTAAHLNRVLLATDAAGVVPQLPDAHTARLRLTLTGDGELYLHRQPGAMLMLR